MDVTMARSLKRKYHPDCQVSGPTAAAVTHHTLDCHVPSRMGQICAHNQPIGRGFMGAEGTEYN